MFGICTHGAIRAPDGWKLVWVQLALLRNEGNRSFLREADRRVRKQVRTRSGNIRAISEDHLRLSGSRLCIRSPHPSKFRTAKLYRARASKAPCPYRRWHLHR
jgi:hypothetical protein